ASWGSTPDIVSIKKITARIDAMSLWNHVLRFDYLRLDQPEINLERNKDGTGNWRFAGSGLPSSTGIAIIPKNRTQFPTLLDFETSKGKITFRTWSDGILRIDFHTLAINAPDDSHRVALETMGAYNGTEITLRGNTDSFVAMRDKSTPFGTNLI